MKSEYEIETIKLKHKKWEHYAPYHVLKVEDYQLLAALSLMIFGVTKINNSFLSSATNMFS